MTALLDALARVSPAPPELLAGRELLRRIDAKFTVTTAELPALLDAFATDYAALALPDGSAIAVYRNFYFDTPDLRCFHDHRRGRRIRRKVRIRQYPDRQVSFLEVKIKQNEVVTDKRRRPVAFDHQTLDDDDLAFLREHAPEVAGQLVPIATIEYRRISLLHLRSPERLTIDFEIQATAGDARCDLGTLAIVELKRGPGTPSIARSTLRRERSLSKYCAVVPLLLPAVRHNRFRPALRMLEGYR